MKLRPLTFLLGVVLGALVYAQSAEAQTLSVSATRVRPTDTISVTITNPPTANDAWIGLYKTTYLNGNFGNRWVWLYRSAPGPLPPQGANALVWQLDLRTVRLADDITTIDQATTTYEFRLFDRANENTATVVTSARFTITDLNPTPTITPPLNPASVVAGSSVTGLQVSGTGFVNGTTLNLGAGITVTRTTLVSDTLLSADITIAANAPLGTRAITVTNPGQCDNNNCVSNTASLVVTAPTPAPTPVLTSVTQLTFPGGGCGINVQLDGANFTSNSIVWANTRQLAVLPSPPRTANRLVVSIAAADIPANGTLDFYVITPAPGGGTSSTRRLMVILPSIAVSPTTVVPGGTIALTISNTPACVTPQQLERVPVPPTGGVVPPPEDLPAGIHNLTLSATMPATVGQYVFRLSANGQVVATSPVITIAAARPVSRVELETVGNDAPDFLWCNKSHRKVTPRSEFIVNFTGRSIISTEETARIIISGSTGLSFNWGTVNAGALDPDPSPILRFYPGQPSPPFGPTARVQVAPGAPLHVYYIEFFPRDSQGVPGERSVGCLVEVVGQLPDVEVTSLAYDPPEAGVRGRTVRMTVRNNMAAPAAPLVSVPWVIRMGGRSTSGVQNNVQPGSTFEVTTRYIKEPNPSLASSVVGTVDPGNSIGENEGQLFNNSKTLAPYPESDPVPVPVHTCESGAEEVATGGGGRGCVTGTPPPAPSSSSCSCANWDVVCRTRCYFSTPQVFQCSSTSDCDSTHICSNGTCVPRCTSNSQCSSGQICPLSGTQARTCVPGHIP